MDENPSDMITNQLKIWFFPSTICHPSILVQSFQWRVITSRFAFLVNSDGQADWLEMFKWIKRQLPKKVRSPNPRPVGHWGYTWQLFAARLVDISDLIRPYAILHHSKLRCWGSRSQCIGHYWEISWQNNVWLSHLVNFADARSSQQGTFVVRVALHVNNGYPKRPAFRAYYF